MEVLTFRSESPIDFTLPTATMSEAESSQAAKSSASPGEDDWRSLTDPNERRKIQNKLAQRKFREKVKQQKEEAEREAENQERASGSYSTPDPKEIDTKDESGLPWGGVSLRHVISTGQAKEQSSRESSIYAAATTRPGDSSRLGLHLIDQYARGSPAWAAWRARFTPFFLFQPTSEAPP